MDLRVNNENKVKLTKNSSEKISEKCWKKIIFIIQIKNINNKV